MTSLTVVHTPHGKRGLHITATVTSICTLLLPQASTAHAMRYNRCLTPTGALVTQSYHLLLLYTMQVEP
jgi:hypothetical protein